ncbi:50S ribosomal protein L3 [Patescibacteria group bacterium]|nr:50S ribosomal protein L3 [Patescibacteria group bacterium]
MKILLGKKLNMTQIYAEDGSVVPVTAVKVGNGVVVQIKNEKKQGYNAVQLGFSEGSQPKAGHPLAGKHVSKSVAGHLKGLVDGPVKLIEMRVENVEKFEKGQKFGLDSFEKGEKVSVSGLTKGQGFAGVIKRHNFSGADASHGTKHHERSPGSIGATDPARVFPGKKMAGHMGNVRATVKNLEIAEIDKENGIIKIKGAVPGARNGLVEIRGEGDMSAQGGSALGGKAVESENKEVKKDDKDDKKDVSKMQDDK